MPKQKHHTATFKAQVVLEMLKEEKTVAQIAAEHQIHPGQLHRWKRQALDNFVHLFTESESVKQQAQAHDGSDGALCPNWQAHDPGRVAQKKSGLDPLPR